MAAVHDSKRRLGRLSVRLCPSVSPARAQPLGICAPVIGWVLTFDILPVGLDCLDLLARRCPSNYTCVANTGAPDGGVTTFSNILWALLNVFVVITKDDWSQVMCVRTRQHARLIGPATQRLSPQYDARGSCLRQSRM